MKRVGIMRIMVSDAVEFGLYGETKNVLSCQPTNGEKILCSVLFGRSSTTDQGQTQPGIRDITKFNGFYILGAQFVLTEDSKTIHLSIKVN